MTESDHCTHTTHKSCISIVPIFNHLTMDEMNEIVQTTHSASHVKGQTIYSAGEPSDGLYIVHKGRVKIYRLAENGKEQLVRILNPGEFTGELSLFNEETHDAYAEAMEPVELCVMNRETFQQFLVKYPAISLKVLKEFSTRLAQTEKQAASIALEPTETRVALYLAELVEEMNHDEIDLPMSRKDLASHLGTTPETISRRLTEFEDAGWIRQLTQKKIKVLDLDSLLLV